MWVVRKSRESRVMLRFLAVAAAEIEKTQVKELLNPEALYKGNGLDNSLIFLVLFLSGQDIIFPQALC